MEWSGVGGNDTNEFDCCGGCRVGHCPFPFRLSPFAFRLSPFCFSVLSCTDPRETECSRFVSSTQLVFLKPLLLQWHSVTHLLSVHPYTHPFIHPSIHPRYPPPFAPPAKTSPLSPLPSPSSPHPPIPSHPILLPRARDRRPSHRGSPIFFPPSAQSPLFAVAPAPPTPHVGRPIPIPPPPPPPPRGVGGRASAWTLFFSFLFFSLPRGGGGAGRGGAGLWGMLRAG